MQEILSLILIGIGLSMDTFSISLSIGTLIKKQKEINLLSITVAIFHFIMPLLGLLLGKNLFQFIGLNPKYLLSTVLIILSIKLALDYFSKEEINYKIGLYSAMALAFSVSIDSFSTGIALYTITQNIILATIIFSLNSLLFTYLGLTIGKYASKKVGKYAIIIGICILLSVAFLHIF